VQARWPTNKKGTLAGSVVYGTIRRALIRASDRAIRHADLLNVPNETEAECLRAELGPKRPLLVQPYGLNAEQAHALLAAALPPDRRHANRKVSFVGMWSPRKGSRDWAQIIQVVRERVPGTQFCFLGTMVDEDVIRTELGPQVPEGALKLVSSYQPEELPALLADSTLGAFPSYIEGFGLAVIEQLAAGLPTVATIQRDRAISSKRGCRSCSRRSATSKRSLLRFAASYCSRPRSIGSCRSGASRRPRHSRGPPSLTPHSTTTALACILPATSCRRSSMKTRPLAIITTRLPPLVCGVGSYSFELQRHWPSESAPVEFLVMEDAPEPDAFAATSTAFNGNASDLLRALERIGAADLVLHYTARAYQRFGCPVWLPSVLARWKQKFGEARVLVIVHELAGPMPMSSRHFWLGKVDSWIVRRLARIADVLVTNTEHHQTKLQSISGRNDVHFSQSLRTSTSRLRRLRVERRPSSSCSGFRSAAFTRCRNSLPISCGGMKQEC
jgi:hypothetical protein